MVQQQQLKMLVTMSISNFRPPLFNNTVRNTRCLDAAVFDQLA